MNCPDPNLCAQLGFHLHGKFWLAWNNFLVSRERAAQLRKAWLDGQRPRDEDVPEPFDIAPAILSRANGETPPPAQVLPGPRQLDGVPRVLPERGPCCGK